MKFRYYGIAELALVVADIGRAKRFYVETVGFEPVVEESHSCILRTGPKRLLGLWEPGVWHSKSLPAESRSRYFGQSLGQAHPVFAVHNDDVPALAERLKTAGYEVHALATHADGARHLYVSDPDNHAVEFWGWNSPE